MLNSLTIPLPTTACAFPLCSCLGDLQDYFSTGTTLHPQQLLHTGSTVAMAMSVAEKRGREREGEQKIGKSIQSWQGNNWFHYIQPADSLYHQWQGDGRHRERACVCVWAVINYCWGQGWGGRTHWLNETKPTVYPSDISLPPSQESEGAQTNPIILIKYFLVLQRTKRWAVYTAKALIRSPCSVQTRSLG